MNYILGRGLIVLFACVVVVAERAGADFYYHPVPAFPFQLDASAGDVSNNGVVVGNADFPGAGITNRAFRWSIGDTSPTMLSDTAGTTFMTAASCISADGSIIVGGGTIKGSVSALQATKWTQSSKLQLLTSTNPMFENARGISDDGSVIVGDGEVPQTAVRWVLGKAQAVPLFNAGAVSGDGAVIVGPLRLNSLNAYRWTATDLQPLGTLPGDTSSSATAVNGDGSVIVGTSSITINRVGYSRAFRWTSAGGMVDLGRLLPTDNQIAAYDVSADGNVIVGTSGDGSRAQAFIWDPVNGMRRLSDLLVYPLPADQGVLEAAYGISPDGTRVVGSMRSPAGFTQAFEVSPDVTPEPGLAMLWASAVGLLLRRRVRLK